MTTDKAFRAARREWKRVYGKPYSSMTATVREAYAFALLVARLSRVEGQ